jgi:hypothetical protein
MLATDPLVYAKKMITKWVWERTDGVIQSGPFAGMQLLQEEAWEDDNQSTKIIGCYEMELHGTIEMEITRLAGKSAKIVNIGCAEGYYAVGIARRLPDAVVTAADVLSDAIRITRATAAVNNVTNIVISDDVDDMMNGPDLIVMDCEGAEINYLDIDKCPGLRRSTVIVECHDMPERSCTNILASRFNDTHEVLFCHAEESRNPNCYPLLRELASHYRWLAVSEGRPNVMSYLVMRPR